MKKPRRKPQFAMFVNGPEIVRWDDPRLLERESRRTDLPEDQRPAISRYRETNEPETDGWDEESWP